ncbi:ABC transporter permease [Streptomyces albipurpureus]|uniref:ABC transporter permease n=1 Tax=Streptomyces albipurpureus TaxID=2897419 RepID=A0ABT0UH87_9ACTN|nr:ABC transporter permease [Streptomyces sp. CWNU-1]MCM2387587.1 ABC transporter permease [Streptomyces sp. CWNU-1]
MTNPVTLDTGRTAPTQGRPAGSTVITPGKAELNPRRYQIRRRRLSAVLSLLPPVVLLVVWQLAAMNDLIDVRFFPPPTEIAESARELISSGALFDHVAATMNRVLLGYVPGVVLGIGFGLLLGTLPIANAIFRTSVTGAYTIPKLGIFPLLLLIFGVGETSKVLLVGMTVFLLVTIATADACHAIPSSMFDVAKAFRANYFRKLFEIVLPAALPPIFTSLRLAMGMSILVVIATEFVAADQGVGYLIWHSWSLFQPSPMYVGIVVSALLGVISTAVIGVVQRLCTPWARTRRRSRLRFRKAR